MSETIDLTKWIFSDNENSQITCKVDSGKLPHGFSLSKKGIISSWKHQVINQPFFSGERCSILAYASNEQGESVSQFTVKITNK